MKLWQKLLIKDLIKFIIFFSIAAFILYFAIDFSVHGNKMFSKSNITILKVLIYYYHNFITHLNLFLSLAFMFAIVKVIYMKNYNNELTALQTAGISKYRLTAPVFFIAAILTLLFYANYEYLTPISSKSIEKFKSTYLISKNKKSGSCIKTLLLNDSTKLIYQHYDFVKKEFFDVFWIISCDDLWHIKYLNAAQPVTTGKFIDHFTRNQDGVLVKKESFPFLDLDQISFNKATNDTLQPFESRSISVLYSQSKHKKFSSKREKAHISSQLNYKLATPLMPFLIAFAFIPPCLKFSRSNRLYVIVFFSLISFIAFYVFMDAMMILSQNSVGSSFHIIWSPIIAALLFFGLKFFKRT